MIEFDEYFSFNNIVVQLALHRAKLSFYIHKNSYLEVYCKVEKWSVKDQYKVEDINVLKKILPPRKEWIRPKFNSKRTNYPSSIDLNKISITNRVFNVHKEFITGRKGFLETPLWYQNLRKFIFDLNINVFQSKKITISDPGIFPAKKNPDKKNDIERRPLAKFLLLDKLILSITNKYLTKLFDEVFLDYSFAFRSKNSEKPGPTYHDAVYKLKEFRKTNIDNDLYVAECDIKKFFDCLDHDIIIKEYYELKHVLEDRLSIKIHQSAEKIFFGYLACYSFNHNVFTKNGDLNYWTEHNDFNPIGNFGWVKELQTAENLQTDKRIGIPQGGALSGLIVNILLHKADKSIQNFQNWGVDFLYLRYCDDMIIVHNSPEKCSLIFNNYIGVLEDLRLIAHDCKPFTSSYSKKFWEDVKSRDVYLWSKKPTGLFFNSPWISFLGYMINPEGDIKVRKKSFDKQIVKHDSEIKRIIKKLDGQADVDLLEHKLSLIRSFETKLYSMAVGKIDISSYKTVPVEMCWAAGFKLIEDNKYTRQQLKKLDRSRKEAVGMLKKYLKKRTVKLETENYQLKSEMDSVANDGMTVEDILKPKKKKRIISKYPHSFYSILEREKDKF